MSVGLYVDLRRMHLTRFLKGNLNKIHWDRRVWEIGYRGPPLAQQKAYVVAFLRCSSRSVSVSGLQYGSAAFARVRTSHRGTARAIRSRMAGDALSRDALLIRGISRPASMCMHFVCRKSKRRIGHCMAVSMNNDGDKRMMRNDDECPGM